MRGFYVAIALLVAIISFFAGVFFAPKMGISADFFPMNMFLGMEQQTGISGTNGGSAPAGGMPTGTMCNKEEEEKNGKEMQRLGENNASDLLGQVDENKVIDGLKSYARKLAIEKKYSASADSMPIIGSVSGKVTKGEIPSCSPDFRMGTATKRINLKNLSIKETVGSVTVTITSGEKTEGLAGASAFVRKLYEEFKQWERTNKIEVKSSMVNIFPSEGLTISIGELNTPVTSIKVDGLRVELTF